MGAPPSGLASAGRMNPPGISYLYCALERETALGELAPAPPIELVAAQFALCSDVRVLNLCELPKSPSVYDVACNDELEWLGFLHSFAREISRPVRKDGSEHVDYVPSQVVCEWFAQVHSEGDGGATLDGILYPSAVVPGGKNLVLFPQRDALHKAMFNAVEFRV
jgi:RES domain-containing protein